MISLVLCILTFASCFYAGRRSLVTGLLAVLTVGYAYGILRGNLQQSASHFIFDAGVFGLYLTQGRNILSQLQPFQLQRLKLWVFFLMAWPLLLFLLPVQDVLIELVGLRGSILLLPFLLLGARLTNDEMYRLGLWIGLLNLLAFGFAVAEYFFGVANFFSYREGVTAIIYRSGDIGSNNAFRIPATFTSAHAYAGTMVTTLPLLIGAWMQKPARRWQGYLIIAALFAAILGVFMAAARIHTIILFVLVVIVTISGRLRIAPQFGWVILLLGIGWVVSSDERLQRFTSLRDTDYVVQRIRGSVNENFTTLALKYPLGNGLGGGGTSLPYFLQDRLKNPLSMESEYARIMLEQGIPGLCLWVAFLFWVFSRRVNPRPSSWKLGRRLAWLTCLSYFATGLLGLGLLTSIPQTCLLLLLTGWITNLQSEPEAGWLNSRSRQTGKRGAFSPLQPMTTR